MKTKNVQMPLATVAPKEPIALLRRIAKKLEYTTNKLVQSVKVVNFCELLKNAYLFTIFAD